ncbi:RNA-directed DNA polymerase, eukaryota [Tanacetum coccineum]
MHKKKVSSVKLGRNKDEGTLSEEHNVQEEDTAHPFFDDIVDKDAAVTPDLERKSDETEEVNIEEKEASNVKSGETEELDLETTQSFLLDGYYYSKDPNFEDEAGLQAHRPISPLCQFSYGVLRNNLKLLKFLVAIFLDQKRFEHSWSHTNQPQQPTQETLETTNDEVVARKIQVEWDAEEERKRKYPLSRELLIWMLDHGMEVEDEDEDSHYFDTFYTQTDCVQDTAQRKKFKRLKASTAFKTKQTDAEQRRPTIKKLEVKQVEFKLGEDCWEKQVNRSTLYVLKSSKDVTVSSKIGDTSLVCSFRRIPRGGIEQNQFDSLVELVRSVTIVPSADRWNWNLESTGIFSVASARRRIDEICLPNIGEETRWVKCVPIKINVLAWKIKTDALPTRFNISRRGIDIQDMSCPICDNAIESTDHLFFRCGLVRDIANKVLSWWNLDHANLNSYAEWKSWLVSIRMDSKLKKMFEGVWYSIWWYVWIYRNKLLFDERKPSKSMLIDNVITSSFYWCK